MIRHIFTLFLNQKRTFGGMLAEQILVFLALLFCFVIVGEKIAQYFSPGILNTKNTFICMLHPVLPSEELSPAELQQKMDRVVEKVRKSPSVIAFGKSKWLVPYIRPEEMYLNDSIQIGTRKIQVFLKFADKYMNQVFQLQMEEGVWLTDEPLEDGSYPAVITSQLMEKLSWSQGIGKRIHYNGIVFTVVGVVAGIKQEPLKVARPTMIVPERVLSDTWFEYTARVKEGGADNFRSLMSKEFNLMMGKDHVRLSFGNIEKWKLNDMRDVFITLLGVGIPTFFLFSFAFIGTFGLFWLYSSKRRKEFALRIVVGSTPRELYCFVISESLLLSVLALLPGIILFCFVYPLDPVHLSALGCACLVMIVFAVFSAWWPAYRVTRVNPVEAMREV